MQKRYLPLLILSTLGVLHASPRYSERDSTERSGQIDEVLVTATQTPRSIKKLPVITQIFTKKDIERISPRSVVDILEMSLPGVQLSVHGGQYRMSVQGLSADYMLILLDGERISSEGNGTVDLNRIDLSLIERVEVIRGAASAIYGSNAIGGVINFITKRASQPIEVSLQGEYGSEGLQRYSTSLGLRFGQISSLSSVSRTLQEEYTVGTDNSNGQGIMPGNKLWNIGQKLQYTSRDRKLDLRLSGAYSYRDQSSNEYQRYRYNVYNMGLKGAYVLSDKNSLNAGYNFERYDRSTFFPKLEGQPTQPLYYLNTHTLRLQYNFGKDHVDHLFFNIGAEYLNESLKGDRLLTEEDRYKTHTISIYGQGDWKLNNKLTLSAGIREDIHSRFKGHMTSRLAMLYNAGDWRFRLSYSEGFRSPTLKNMYMYWDHLGMFDIIGNPQLKPEKSQIISFAPEYQHKGFSWTLIASYNNIRDKIDLKQIQLPSGRLQQLYSNTDARTEIWSIQSNLRWLLAKGLRLHADYAWVYDTDRVNTQEGERVSRVSTRPHNLTASLTYDHLINKCLLNLGLSVRYSSSVRIASTEFSTGIIKAETLEAYSTARLNASLEWNRHLKFTLGIDNLLDYQPRTATFTGSLSPGRTFFASLRYTI